MSVEVTEDQVKVTSDCSVKERLCDLKRTKMEEGREVGGRGKGWIKEVK